MRLFLFAFHGWVSILGTALLHMAYYKVPRPPNALPDELVWKALGLSRATFFRKLKVGLMTSPVLRDGTSRRWWTPTDVEIAKQEISATKDLTVSRTRRRL